MKKVLNTTVATILSLVSSLALSVLPANAAAEEGISKSEILLGASFPQTGPAAPYHQDFFIGAKAYFDYLNSKGGIHGRSIRLILMDDGGGPNKTVSNTASLLMKDKVFALFNSAPLTAAHFAMVRGTEIAKRNIPNLAVTAPFSGFSDAAKYPTSFQINGNQKQEFKSLVHFYENSLNASPLYPTLPEYDIGSDFEYLKNALGKKIVPGVGRISNIPYELPYALNEKSGKYEPRQTGELVILSLWPRHNSILGGKSLVVNELQPLLVRGSSISSSASNFLVANTKSRNIYANFNMPLYTDTSDPFIAFFTSVFRQFVPTRDFSLEINVNDGSKSAFNYVSQQMFEGANAAYVVAQAIAAIGPEPTRTALMSYLRTQSKTISTATFSPLNYSSTSNIGDSVQYIAKYDGTKWVKHSDFYQINPDGTSIRTLTPQRIPLLPNGIPVINSANSVVKKIACVKGKVTREVSGMNPVCPKGFRQK